MRHPAAYYLLLLYSTVLMRCAIPIACDDLSHVFNEEAHIATIHAVYGNDHVEKEIAADENNSNKNQTGIRYEDQVPVHITTEALRIIAVATNIKSPFSLPDLLKIPAVYLLRPFQPPRYS